MHLQTTLAWRVRLSPQTARSRRRHEHPGHTQLQQNMAIFVLYIYPRNPVAFILGCDRPDDVPSGAGGIIDLSKPGQVVGMYPLLLPTRDFSHII